MDSSIEKITQDLDKRLAETQDLLINSLDSLIWQKSQTEDLLINDYEKLRLEVEWKREKLKNLQKTRKELELQISESKLELAQSENSEIPQSEGEIGELLSLYLKLSRIKWDYKDLTSISGTFASSLSFKLDCQTFPNYFSVNQLWDLIGHQVI